jgi:hypothetical protein
MGTSTLVIREAVGGRGAPETVLNRVGEPRPEPRGWYRVPSGYRVAHDGVAGFAAVLR